MRFFLLFFLAVLMSGCDRVILSRPKYPLVTFYIFYGPHIPGRDLMAGAGTCYPSHPQEGRIRNPVADGSCDARMGSKHAISVDFLGHNHKGEDVYEATVEVTMGTVTRRVKAQGAFGGMPAVIHSDADFHVFIAPSNPPPGPMIAAP
jgi:hypothetical protein